MNNLVYRLNNFFQTNVQRVYISEITRVQNKVLRKAL